MSHGVSEAFTPEVKREWRETESLRRDIPSCR